MGSDMTRASRVDADIAPEPSGSYWFRCRAAGAVSSIARHALDRRGAAATVSRESLQKKSMTGGGCKVEFVSWSHAATLPGPPVGKWTSSQFPVRIWTCRNTGCRGSVSYQQCGSSESCPPSHPACRTRNQVTVRRPDLAWRVAGPWIGPWSALPPSSRTLQGMLQGMSRGCSHHPSLVQLLAMDTPANVPRSPAPSH